jgi:hypothetical protein
LYAKGAKIAPYIFSESSSFRPFPLHHLKQVKQVLTGFVEHSGKDIGNLSPEQKQQKCRDDDGTKDLNQMISGLGLAACSPQQNYILCPRNQILHFLILHT